MKEWESFTNQEQWKEYIQNLIKTNDQAYCRGMVVIYRLQTEEEKSIRETTVNNGVGFGTIDADIMTSVAEKIIAGETLTLSEVFITRNKLKKYWKQLMRVSKGEIKVP